jgi:thiamine thiazole synthase
MSDLEIEISRGIIKAFHENLYENVISDVVVVGAGPSGLMAAYYLVREGFKVVIIEKRLSPGGGIWGGGMGMNFAVVQENVLPLLKEIGIRYAPGSDTVFLVDAIELAAGLCFAAVNNGAVLLNLLVVEDVVIHRDRVEGVVVNRTGFSEQLPVDPLTIKAKAVIDATGHEAVVVKNLWERDLLDRKDIPGRLREGPMNAASGEAFVVANTGEIYDGVWICGMSVCATFNGPRMGPIFGGMLLSGKRVAELISTTLGSN